MLPWAALCFAFLSLQLGSFLIVNGESFSLRLPKYFLNDLLPFVFQSIYAPGHFQMGVIFPLAVLSCLGLRAFQTAWPPARSKLVLLALIGIVSCDYYLPVIEQVIPRQQTAFNDWLVSEESKDIALINLPMGRKNSKTYNFYQSINGYPHAEGAISRTPDHAFNYIRSNLLLRNWNNQRAILCTSVNHDQFLDGLEQLDNDGFTHIIHHLNLPGAKDVARSFDKADPSYKDDFVSIYRLPDLADSCK